MSKKDLEATFHEKATLPMFPFIYTKWIKVRKWKTIAITCPTSKKYQDARNEILLIVKQLVRLNTISSPKAMWEYLHRIGYNSQIILIILFVH